MTIINGTKNHIFRPYFMALETPNLSVCISFGLHFPKSGLSFLYVAYFLSSALEVTMDWIPDFFPTGKTAFQYSRLFPGFSIPWEPCQEYNRRVLLAIGQVDTMNSTSNLHLVDPSSRRIYAQEFAWDSWGITCDSSHNLLYLTDYYDSQEYNERASLTTG